MTAVETRAWPVEEIGFGGARAFSVELFTPAEAAGISAAADSVPAGLRHQRWGARGGAGMATIGEPVYVNRDRLDYYRASARAESRLLYRHFRLAHERVATYFEHRYALPVVYAEELAVPGFHIFDYDGPGEYEGGSWHVDALETQVPYLIARRADITAVVNFTVPVQLPDGGSGMDLEADAPGAARGRRGGGQAITVPYRTGTMVFTESEVWHRIGRSVCLSPRQRRVTYQGHGVRLDGCWILFW
jgi:hypothetical protein